MHAGRGRNGRPFATQVPGCMAGVQKVVDSSMLAHKCHDQKSGVECNLAHWWLAPFLSKATLTLESYTCMCVRQCCAANRTGQYQPALHSL